MTRPWVAITLHSVRHQTPGASGTGSASAAIASIITGRTDRTVRAVCDGGVLEIAWSEDTVPLHQIGEAELVFDGEWAED